VNDRLGPYLLGPNDTPENGIYTGDARELAKAIPDESVDLIFTDPPYSKKYLYLYSWLAEIASTKLKADGLCMAYVGKGWLNTIVKMMDEHLKYVWIASIWLKGQTKLARAWKVQDSWRPILAYGRTARGMSWARDSIISPGPSKKNHKWGQNPVPAMYWIDKLTNRTAITLDPFCGGGTVPAVCRVLGRKYLAFDIDFDAVETARERIRKTQMPLPGLVIVQNELAL